MGIRTSGGEQQYGARHGGGCACAAGQDFGGGWAISTAKLQQSGHLIIHIILSNHTSLIISSALHSQLSSFSGVCASTSA
eukprot:1158456-Pelagomonas_calceolata.AAC.4